MWPEPIPIPATICIWCRRSAGRRLSAKLKEKSIMRYGYRPLGHLGSHLAANLLRAGFAVSVYDLIRKLAKRHLELGGHWAATPRAAANSDTVITCLPSPAVSTGPDRGGRYFWRTQVRRHLDRDEHVGPRGGSCAWRKLRRKPALPPWEAPVTGGVHRAAAGEITVLAGGGTAPVRRPSPGPEAMGGEIFHMGPLGSASVIKVITNMLAFIQSGRHRRR